MSSTDGLKKFKIERETPLTFSPEWSDPAHQFSREEAVAVQAALLSGRPLLIEGAPGAGKTQIAAAAAAALGRELIVYVVNSNTKPEDLFWRYDALQRLNDAQEHKAKASWHYLSKGPLWQAFDTNDSDAEAEDPNKKSKDTKEKDESLGQPLAEKIPRSIEPYVPKVKKISGKVLLIDEIDKADRSVPNSLLEVFGHRRFRCPYLEKEVHVSSNDAPLIIITSNREQQLPPAFIRRCLVLRVMLPKQKLDFASKLAARAVMHFGENFLEPKQYTDIAETLYEMRKKSNLPASQQPGQAEYFDLVRAIGYALKNNLGDESGKSLSFEKLLQEMQGLAFNKAGLEYPNASDMADRD